VIAERGVHPVEGLIGARFSSPARAATAAANGTTKKKAKAAAKPGPKLSGPLSAQVETILAQPGARGALWGISVTTLEGAPVFALNDDKRFQPASNEKLLTTATAFQVLPANLTSTTLVIAAGTGAGGLLPGGVVAGDLIFYGQGDPSMSARMLPFAIKTQRVGDPLAAVDQLAVQAVAAGVREVKGNIVGDDSYFSYEPFGPGWSWNDLQWEYGAPVSALTVNDNVIYLTVTPGAEAGAPVTFSWLPAVDYYKVESSIRTVAAAPGVKTRIGAERLPGSKTVRLWGTMRAGGMGVMGPGASSAGGVGVTGTTPPGSVSLALAVEDAAQFAAEALKERLEAHGVRVDGAAVARHRPQTGIETEDAGSGGGSGDSGGIVTAEDGIGRGADGNVTANDAIAEGKAGGQEESAVANGQVPAGQVLARRVSPTLRQDLTVINKVSQNLHAELLLEQLGVVEQGGGGTGSVSTRAAGLRAVRQFLGAAGVSPEDVTIYDGSGLSADDMVTPRALTAVLRYAASRSWGAEFRATLPVGGVDGTLADRFGGALAGKVTAKTGTLKEDSSLSGYVTAASGRTIVFSILCNRHLPGTASRAVVDRLVTAIAAAE
jgi:D-alanyl-D-alanine carboxypeptidase/D-alanyl-D-alanine-endopeptidase (penicillin-binding protein 4)